MGFNEIGNRKEELLDCRKIMNGRLAQLIFGTVILLMLFIPANLYPQADQGVSDGVRTAVNGDSVYVFHNAPFRVGLGFNIYRQDPGETDFQQLNSEPVYGIEQAAELPGVLGDRYDPVAEQMGVENQIEMFLDLRTDLIASRVYSFAYPEVAEATGRLFVDTTAPVGETVTYRIEFVDDLGEPTGESLESTHQLTRTTMPVPDNLSASHTGREVTLNWSYPTVTEENDDKVIRFAIYRLTDDGTRQQVNEELLIRFASQTDYSTTFTVPAIGVEENFTVNAVNIADRESESSEALTYFISDNVPPARVGNVQATKVDAGAEITWAMAPELDVQGYRVYRRQRLGQDSMQLNEELLAPDQTVFTDEAIGEGLGYFYQIVAVDTAGNRSPISVAAHIRVTDRTPPPPVSNVSAEALDSAGFRIQWEHPEISEDFKTYFVLRRRYEQDTTRAFNRVNQENLRETAVVDSGISRQGLAEGGTYQYKVVAVDSANNQSDGAFAILKVPDNTPPAPPNNISGSNQDGIRVNLSWNSSTSSDVTRYFIYRAALGNEVQVYDSTTVQQRYLRDEQVSIGNTYVYRVSAMDSLGNESELSVYDTVQVRDYTPPRVVRNVRASNTEQGVMLSWEPVPSTDLIGYRVYRAEIPTGVYESVNTQPIDTTGVLYEDPEQRWWYNVRAIDSSGNLSKSSEPVQVPEEE